MPFSSLLTKLKSVKAVPPERFLAIEVGPEIVKTAVWQVVGGSPQVIGVGEFKDWDGGEESLLTAIDESLASSLETIEPEPNQAVLGLPESWVGGTEINQEGKKLLRAVAAKLEIKFLGFVVSSEAIIHELRTQEGTPVTAILLMVTETELTVQVIQLGKVVGSELVGRSEDLSADVEEGLVRIKIKEPLPARMILTDGHLDLEGAAQMLLSYNWQERLNFLHVPKVDILKRDFSIRAVADAGGTEAAKSLGLAVKPVEVSEVDGEAKEEKLTEAPGFIREDVLTQPQPVTEAEEVSKVQPQETVLVREAGRMSQFKEMLTSSIGRGWTIWKSRGRWWMGLAGGILGLVVVMGFLYWNVPSTQITVYLKPQVLERELTVQAVTATEGEDLKEGIIAAQLLETEVDGVVEKQTTGEAVVGEKARGKVTIYNKTTSAKTWESGTALTGPKDLKFTLDQEVTVASQSSTPEGVTFGKADGDITAAQIGTESNLSAETELTIGNFSASAHSARTAVLLGGSAATARVVSEDDQQQALEELKDNLREEGKKKLAEKLTDEEKLLEAVVKEEVVNQQFSKAVGEAAEEVSLVMKLKLVMFKVKKADLDLLLWHQAQGSIPANFRLDPASSHLVVKETEVESDTKVNLKTVAALTLVPELDSEEIRRNIRGRYFKLAKSYFESLPNFEKVEMKTRPAVVGRLGRLPFRAERISVEVKVSE